MPDGSISNGRGTPLRWILAGAVGVALLASALWYGLSFGWINLFIEGSWIELVQLFVWLAGACWAWWRLPRTAPGRDRWMLFWLAVILSLGAAREQDLQKYVNPQRFGDFGVSFRIAWWLDPAVPLAVKLTWVLVGALLAAALTLPLLRARPRLLLLTLGLDRAMWLFGLGGFFLMLGYGADDLFGRGMLMSTRASEVLEETSELLGVALVVASVAATGCGRLDEREARARRVSEALRARWRRSAGSSGGEEDQQGRSSTAGQDRRQEGAAPSSSPS